MQLIIALMILAICLGIVYEGLDGYSRARAETLASSLARAIDTTADQVARGGNMTTLMVQVRLDESNAGRLEWFRIGTGPQFDGISYKVKGGQVHQSFVGQPLIKSVDGLYEEPPLELPKGSYLLNLRHVQDTREDPADFISVWVVWTG